MKNNSLNSFFLDNFSKHGNKTALTFFRGNSVETVISYKELIQDSSSMAGALINLGIEKGDRVIIYLDKSIVFVVAHLALQRLGAVTVPLNPGFKKNELYYFIKDTETKLILCGIRHEKMIKEIDHEIKTLLLNTAIPYQDLDLFRPASIMLTDPKPEPGPDDHGLIIYTSGTTGKPKGALLTQRNLIHDACNIIKKWEISETDVLCHALPLFHVHGLCFALHTALVAGSHVLIPDEFSPDNVINLLSKKEGRHVCSIFMAVPSMYVKMMDFIRNKRYDFSHMRLWTSGSAPLPAKDFERIKALFGQEPVEREGMSETGMNFSNPLHGTRKPGSIGLPMPGLEVRIVNLETFKDVSPGEEGEIWLKGPSITPGYWRKPDETAQAFEKGWFRTGDLGRIDKNGYYYLTDRCKHIIISGGENISPKEIEGIINLLEDVLESSVIGMPDEKWGERVMAAVVVKSDTSLDAGTIQQFCRKHFHDWKCPKEIFFLKELPKNAMGKIMKEEIKKIYARSKKI
ncbi:malonyl-CoA/methylmalonyl-CoA synthetase [Desulfosarcina sp. BuS5]|uniref:class I adenylate-forming enzyme family protein n=1 Tax=Desulfosarcina sp. BuS5 TaxID=933262 RepID=UPI000684C52F|nr:AMP-binding protein [Desulfosarcina sp. BuS5]WDN89205.1 malonyl-CoA/methylmalonyl-CoA synthetase [Desulfosarcina sp. BuS5]